MLELRVDKTLTFKDPFPARQCRPRTPLSDELQPTAKFHTHRAPSLESQFATVQASFLNQHHNAENSKDTAVVCRPVTMFTPLITFSTDPQRRAQDSFHGDYRRATRNSADAA